MKYYYRVYGLNIESTIEVPELEIIDSDCDIDIDVNLSYGVVNDEIKDLIDKGHSANYSKLDMWFDIKEVAIYHIYNGDTVIIEPYEDADFQLVKVYILGSVLGMALIQNDIVAIHGGGIVIDGKGYIFTGDKGAGKSTITTALRKKGYKFMADDVCAIRNGSINNIYPGFGYQKLCEDTMIKLGYDTSRYEPFRNDTNIKYIVPAKNEFVDYEVLFDAIFELSVGDVETVEVQEIMGSEKLNRLIINIFRVETIYYSGGLGAIYFRKCLHIAKNIRYYKIIRPKDVFSVDEQVKSVEEIVFGSLKKVDDMIVDF